jgi:cation transport ATPase
MNEEILLEQIALLRRALVAAAAVANREGIHPLASAILDAADANSPEERRAAVSVLEEDAGYIAGGGEGECYP